MAPKKALPNKQQQVRSEAPIGPVANETCKLPVWDDADIQHESFCPGGDLAALTSTAIAQTPIDASQMFSDTEHVSTLENCFGSYISSEWCRPSGIFKPFKPIVYRPTVTGNAYEFDAATENVTVNPLVGNDTRDEDLPKPATREEMVRYYRRMRNFRVIGEDHGQPHPGGGSSASPQKGKAAGVGSPQGTTAGTTHRRREKVQGPVTPHFMRAFNSALTFLSQNQTSIPQGQYGWELIYPQTPGTNLPIYNPYGKYAVKLFFGGAFRKVIIDDRLPTDANGHSLLSVTDQKEIWPALLAKAMLKALGPHHEKLLITNPTWIVSTLLSGWVPQVLRPRHDEVSAFHLCLKAIAAPRDSSNNGNDNSKGGTGQLLLAATCGDSNIASCEAPFPEEHYATAGINSVGMYCLMDVKPYNNTVLMRLVYPGATWKGTYMYNSPAWTDELVEAIGFDPKRDRDQDDLQKKWNDFWITWENFQEYFSSLVVFRNVADSKQYKHFKQIFTPVEPPVPEGKGAAAGKGKGVEVPIVDRTTPKNFVRWVHVNSSGVASSRATTPATASSHVDGNATASEVEGQQETVQLLMIHSGLSKPPEEQQQTDAASSSAAITISSACKVSVHRYDWNASSQFTLVSSMTASYGCYQILPLSLKGGVSHVLRVTVEDLHPDCLMSIIGTHDFAMGDEKEICRGILGVVNTIDAGVYAACPEKHPTLWFKRSIVVKQPTTAHFALSTLPKGTDLATVKQIPHEAAQVTSGKKPAAGAKQSKAAQQQLENVDDDIDDTEHAVPISEHVRLVLVNVDTAEVTTDTVGKILNAKLQPTKAGYVIMAYVTPPEGDSYGKGYWKLHSTSDRLFDTYESLSFDENVVRTGEYTHNEYSSLFRLNMSCPEPNTTCTIRLGVIESWGIPFSLEWYQNGKLIDSRKGKKECILEHVMLPAGEKSGSSSFSLQCTLDKAYTQLWEEKRRIQVVEQFRADCQEQQTHLGARQEELRQALIADPTYVPREETTARPGSVAHVGLSIAYNLSIHCSSTKLEIKEDNSIAEDLNAIKASWSKKDTEAAPPPVKGKAPGKNQPVVDEAQVRQTKGKEARERFLSNRCGVFFPHSREMAVSTATSGGVPTSNNNASSNNIPVTVRQVAILYPEDEPRMLHIPPKEPSTYTVPQQQQTIISGGADSNPLSENIVADAGASVSSADDSSSTNRPTSHATPTAAAPAGKSAGSTSASAAQQGDQGASGENNKPTLTPQQQQMLRNYRALVQSFIESAQTVTTTIREDKKEKVSRMNDLIGQYWAQARPERSATADLDDDKNKKKARSLHLSKGGEEKAVMMKMSGLKFALGMTKKTNAVDELNRHPFESDKHEVVIGQKRLEFLTVWNKWKVDAAAVVTELGGGEEEEAGIVNVCNTVGGQRQLGPQLSERLTSTVVDKFIKLQSSRRKHLQLFFPSSSHWKEWIDDLEDFVDTFISCLDKDISLSEQKTLCSLLRREREETLIDYCFHHVGPCENHHLPGALLLPDAIQVWRDMIIVPARNQALLLMDMIRRHRGEEEEHNRDGEYDQQNTTDEGKEEGGNHQHHQAEVKLPVGQLRQAFKRARTHTMDLITLSLYVEGNRARHHHGDDDEHYCLCTLFELERETIELLFQTSEAEIGGGTDGDHQDKSKKKVSNQQIALENALEGMIRASYSRQFGCSSFTNCVCYTASSASSESSSPSCGESAVDTYEDWELSEDKKPQMGKIVGDNVSSRILMAVRAATNHNNNNNNNNNRNRQSSRTTGRSHDHVQQNDGEEEHVLSPGGEKGDDGCLVFVDMVELLMHGLDDGGKKMMSDNDGMGISVQHQKQPQGNNMAADTVHHKVNIIEKHKPFHLGLTLHHLLRESCVRLRHDNLSEGNYQEGHRNETDIPYILPHLLSQIVYKSFHPSAVKQSVSSASTTSSSWVSPAGTMIPPVELLRGVLHVHVLKPMLRRAFRSTTSSSSSVMGIPVTTIKKEDKGEGSILATPDEAMQQQQQKEYLGQLMAYCCQQVVEDTTTSPSSLFNRHTSQQRQHHDSSYMDITRFLVGMTTAGVSLPKVEDQQQRRQRRRLRDVFSHCTPEHFVATTSIMGIIHQYVKQRNIPKDIVSRLNSQLMQGLIGDCILPLVVGVTSTSSSSSFFDTLDRLCQKRDDENDRKKTTVDKKKKESGRAADNDEEPTTADAAAIRVAVDSEVTRFLADLNMTYACQSFCSVGVTTGGRQTSSFDLLKRAVTHCLSALETFVGLQKYFDSLVSSSFDDEGCLRAQLTKSHCYDILEFVRAVDILARRTITLLLHYATAATSSSVMALSSTKENNDNKIVAAITKDGKDTMGFIGTSFEMICSALSKISTTTASSALEEHDTKDPVVLSVSIITSLFRHVEESWKGYTVSSSIMMRLSGDEDDNDFNTPVSSVRCCVDVHHQCHVTIKGVVSAAMRRFSRNSTLSYQKQTARLDGIRSTGENIGAEGRRGGGKRVRE